MGNHEMCKWATRDETDGVQVFRLSEETMERLEGPVELPVIIYVVVSTIQVTLSKETRNGVLQTRQSLDCGEISFKDELILPTPQRDDRAPEVAH
ncbi:hypothetical protein LEMLEM_LOCUS10202 [Lemmus lemmus]